MPKKVKSQWDFGDLFETAQAREKDTTPTAIAKEVPDRRIFSVGELTGQVRRVLEKDFGRIWVTGEVSNFRAQASGHAYFTLKDSRAQLSCVLFRGEAKESRKFLEDGQKVMLGGDITVYEPRGQYQLRVIAVELQGVGALQLAFEKLKQRLQAEGLFDRERKRPLPQYPQRIGLVTSSSGAAMRDVLHVVKRRQPGLEIVLVACRVQGNEAAGEIASAIRNLNRWSQSDPARALDLVLITRGGGSLEDLWAFNEEEVARAVFESELPVVSAVGHEIDFTISDFVADFRAATPSAAAELITEGPHRSRQFVRETALRLRQLAVRRVQQDRVDLEQWERRLSRVHPRRVFQEKLQWLDDLQMQLNRRARQGWRFHASSWNQLTRRLSGLKPSLTLGQRRGTLDDLHHLLKERVRHQIVTLRHGLKEAGARLRLLGPEQVLARGYSITMEGDTGRVIRNAGHVHPGQTIRTRLGEGEIDSTVAPGKASSDNPKN